MLFVPDDKAILEIDDPMECIREVHKHLMPRLKELLDVSLKSIELVYGIDVDARLTTRSSPSPRPSTKEYRYGFEKGARCVQLGILGKRLKEGYPKLEIGRLRNAHPSFLHYTIDFNGIFVNFDPFAMGWHDDSFVAIIKQFLRSHWTTIQEYQKYLQFQVYDDEQECFVDSENVTDICSLIEADTNSLLFLCNGRYIFNEFAEVNEDEREDVAESILGDLVFGFVSMYPFLDACISLGKGESTDNFVPMLKQLKKWCDDVETEQETIQVHSPVISNEEISIEEYDATEDIVDFDDIPEYRSHTEGAAIRVLMNRYERNAKLRGECLQKFGYTCVICGFNFEERYGDIGKGFIHVHHLEDIASKGGEYQTTYEKLRPVCPNCHAMLHKGKPEAYTPEELREMLQ